MTRPKSLQVHVSLDLDERVRAAAKRRDISVSEWLRSLLSCACDDDDLASIGDRKQLGAVDAGKPFDVMQKAGVETAVMTINLRARERALRDAQYAAQGGHIDEALRHLGDHVVLAGNDAAIQAAAAWLSLAPTDRETTSIYASGRSLRSAVNEAVQTGLKANGELGPGAMRLAILSRVNVTREEQRHARSYPTTGRRCQRRPRSRPCSRG